MTTTIQDIPALLHEARLFDLEWKPEMAELRLSFACLRRNTDGSEMADTSVDLVLAGVERIAAFYSPAAIEVRPSTFRVASPLSMADLIEWQRPAVEAHPYINSVCRAWDMATSSHIDWLAGSPVDPLIAGSGLLSVSLLFDRPYRNDAAETTLFVQCASIQAMAGGVPLALEDWSEQYDAWWKGWRDYWAQKKDDDDGPTSALEETFIPAGLSTEPDDPSYRPPRRPAFQVGTTDVPADLLAPVRDFHQGLHGQDWLTMARAYPTLDDTDAERAQKLEKQYRTYDFGRWVFLRHIDSWWTEGSRACVVVRGIEHTAPLDGDPAKDRETVITYGLRKVADRWIIWTWSQGWPQYGSAPKLAEEQLWRHEWGLGV